MLSGYPPFCADSALGVFDLALHADPSFPAHVPAPARRCIAELLRRAPHARLGGARGARGGAADVASAEFFRAPPHPVDWRALLAREVAAPVIPVVPSSCCVELAAIEAVLPHHLEDDGDDDDDDGGGGWSAAPTGTGTGIGGATGSGGIGGATGGIGAAAAALPERLRARDPNDVAVPHQRRGGRSSTTFAEFEQLRPEDPNAETQSV